MCPRIDSVSNARVKAYCALATPRGRREHGRYQLEGTSLIREALEAGVPLEVAYVCPERIRDAEDEAVAAALAERTEVIEVSERVLERMASTVSPQAVAAEASLPHLSLADIEVGRECLVVVAADTQDPGNLGTIIRTAHAVGAVGLVALGHTVDPYSPKAVRATMGSLFSLRVVREPDASALLEWCRERDVVLVAATVGAGRSLYDTPLPARMAALLGSERHGLPPDLSGAHVHEVRIPMPGGAESLNVSVAAGVLMYEYRRQHPV